MVLEAHSDSKTRKSSWVNARGIPLAPHICPREVPWLVWGYPCIPRNCQIACVCGGVPLSCLGVPQQAGTVTMLCSPAGPVPAPPPPVKRVTPGKEPVSRGNPPPQWMDRHLRKHYFPASFGMRVVKMVPFNFVEAFQSFPQNRKKNFIPHQITEVLS